MVFVSGGTGLIGSHLLFELLSSGKKVRALKRDSSNTRQVLKIFSYYSDKPEELFSRIDWVNGDILDYFTLEKLIMGAEEVYHCAAIISFSKGDSKKMISNNVEGTANMVNASLENGVKKFCHLSSVSALGQHKNGFPTDEQTNWVPSKKVTAYSESKFFSETEIWRGMEEGLDAVIINPSVVLGPGNWNTGSSKLFKTVWDGLRFYTRGTTGFVDVKDVVKAMILLMQDEHFDKNKNQRFILNSENWNYQQLFNLIADYLQKPRPSWIASRFMLEISWRSASLINRVAQNTFPITRETAAAASSFSEYDGSKISRLTDFSYLPIHDSIKQTTAMLLRDMKSSKPD